MNAPFYLLGIDFEGDSREYAAGTFEQALDVALACSDAESPGPAWLSWEIWGNHPETEDWIPLAVSIQFV